ncbi:MAG: glycosyltransferase family A protein [Candidatus Neomarinimicrobiota bacterium]
MTRSLLADTREIGLDDTENTNISVIIPARDCGDHLERVLEALKHQTLRPNEVVIVDSSDSDSAEAIISDYQSTSRIIYKKVKKAYPGEARNIGVEIANGDWIGFLDCKTLPEDDWLDKCSRLASAYHSDLVFGMGKFEARTPFQKSLRAATYGLVGHHTVPGTLVKKIAFGQSGGFQGHLRAGEDIEWRDRIIDQGLKIHFLDEPVIKYLGLPKTFLLTIKKYFISARHTARANILVNLKNVYLSLFLIFLTILAAKWNALIGWDEDSVLYLPHITKLYLLSILLLFLLYRLIRFFYSFGNLDKTLTITMKFIIFVLFSGLIYRWNEIFAGWVEDAVWYVPHITKIYVGTLVSLSIFYRGILLPLKRAVSPSFLFPVKWVQVGILGLSLDLAKAPGYVYGAIVTMSRGFRL